MISRKWFFASRYHKRFHYFLEKKIVRTADKIISTSKSLCKIINKYSEPEEKFRTITNGFDFDDFKEYRKNPDFRKNSEKFVLCFVGTFHTGIHPNNLIKAVNILIKKKNISKEQIEIRIVGANNPKKIEKYDLYGICRFVGQVSHKKAIGHLFQSNILLLLLSKRRGGAIIPGKVFEYIASDRPILALVPKEGEVAKIVNNTRTGTVVEFDNIKKIENAIFELYCDWLSGKNRFTPKWENIRKYSREKLTEELSGIIDSITFQNKLPN